MYTLAERLKAINQYEHNIQCSLICINDGHEWQDYLNQIKWRCQQIGINYSYAMKGIYSYL